MSFSSKLPRFSKNSSFQANLAEKSNSYVFKMIFGVCSYIRLDSNSTFQILRIHEKFSLEPILGQEVTSKTLSLGPEKPKILKYFVSNQILEEVYLWLVWVLYGLICSRNTPQCDLFMTQVDFMLFLKLWVWSIQALPNPVWYFPNYGTLFLKPSNIYRKDNKSIYNLISHIFSLILNLPIDSSPWFSKKNTML